MTFESIAEPSVSSTDEQPGALASTFAFLAVCLVSALAFASSVSHGDPSISESIDSIDSIASVSGCDKKSPMLTYIHTNGTRIDAPAVRGAVVSDRYGRSFRIPDSREASPCSFESLR